MARITRNIWQRLKSTTNRGYDFGCAGSYYQRCSFTSKLARKFWLYWQQIVQIGLLTKQLGLNAGAEWFQLDRTQLLTFHLYVFPLVLECTGHYNLYYRRWQTETMVAFSFALVFIVFTYRSRRYIELSVPLSGITNFNRRSTTGITFPRRFMMPLTKAGSAGQV